MTLSIPEHVYLYALVWHVFSALRRTIRYWRVGRVVSTIGLHHRCLRLLEYFDFSDGRNPLLYHKLLRACQGIFTPFSFIVDQVPWCFGR